MRKIYFITFNIGFMNEPDTLTHQSICLTSSDCLVAFITELYSDPDSHFIRDLKINEEIWDADMPDEYEEYLVEQYERQKEDSLMDF